MTDDPGAPAAGFRSRCLFVAALFAFAVDTSVFHFGARALGVTGQYLVRALIAGILAAALIATRRASLGNLGLSFAGFPADALWTGRIIAILLGVSVFLMAVAVLLIRTFEPSIAFWPLETFTPYWFLNSIILAPLIEEFIYRGLMVPGLQEAYGDRGAIVAGSLVFYALHLVYGYPPYLLHYVFAGAVLTWAFLKRGRLWICVLLHAGGNLLVVVDDAVLRWWPEAFRAIFGRLPPLP